MSRRESISELVCKCGEAYLIFHWIIVNVIWPTGLSTGSSLPNFALGLQYCDLLDFSPYFLYPLEKKIYEWDLVNVRNDDVSDGRE